MKKINIRKINRKNEKKLKSEFRWGLFFGIILTIIFYFLFMILSDLNISEKTMSEINENDIINACKNKSIFDAGMCAKSIVHANFYYNISNIGRDMTWEELKEEGGVCKQYAELYEEIGDELGFYSKKFVFTTSENSTLTKKHAIAIWSNEEGYVVLDQQTSFKFKFKQI